MKMTTIQNATIEQAPEIAALIMIAMTDECCLHFCGEGHDLQDFRKMMTQLVQSDHSQYSYRNTLVAMDADKVIGAAVSYDGALLYELRQAFIDKARECLDKDHSAMPDETQQGELYLDSLAVLPDYRHQGIATRLLKATRQKANAMGLPHVGLLVDNDNPTAETLYTSIGFRHVDDNQWGGHAMKHLIL